MLSTINSFLESLRDKKICFLGYGRTNRPLLKLFAGKCSNMEVRAAQISDNDKKQLKEMDVPFSAGENYLKKIDADIVFRSPGIYYLKEEINDLRKRNIIVTSEIEVFFRLCPCKIIAITGSDGKTTTTSLIAKMLGYAGYNVHVGGNIGKPLLPIISNIKASDYAVVELSSFQLMSMNESPDIAIITNISPNHLDVHSNMEEYIGAKKNILIHQSAFDSAILNADNSICTELKNCVRGKLLEFSRLKAVENGAFLRSDGMICLAKNSKTKELFPSKCIKIPGYHNIENYMAAIASLSSIIPIAAMEQCAVNFEGVPHRMEFVREINGILFYNDAIATTPTRTISGTLSAYNRRIILICGGYDKKIPFDELAEVINQKVKTLILFGATSGQIEKAVRSATNFESEMLEIINVSSMEEAVKFALDNAMFGDIVSLSPSCASFDMYPDFEAKGNHFKDIVNKIEL